MLVKTKIMTDWWQSPLGQYVLTQEQTELQSLSRHFYGFLHLQIYGEKNILPQVTHFHKQTRMAELAEIMVKQNLCHLSATALIICCCPMYWNFLLIPIVFYVKLKEYWYRMEHLFYVVLIPLVYGV